jgi:hypothetical protein
MKALHVRIDGTQLKQFFKEELHLWINLSENKKEAKFKSWENELKRPKWKKSEKPPTQAKTKINKTKEAF